MAIQTISLGTVPNDGTGDDPRTAGGKINQNFTQLDNKVFNVLAYGAVGDGSTDDTSAIQDAVDDACIAGGTVYFPSTLIYKITDEIVVSSEFPVHLRSEMDGAIFNAGWSAPGIIIGANISGAFFKYTAPDSGSRTAHGGGKISGLNFYDATGSGSEPGNYTCTAVLDLNDFVLSCVSNCTFQWINGSAIKGEYLVMSSIRGNRIRYCGDTNKPAIYLPSTSSTYPAQSMTIADNRLEVCHDDYYLETGANSTQIKLMNNGFEADTAVADSNQQFVVIAGVGHAVMGNHFNRNTNTQLNIQATSVAVAGNNFEAGPTGTAACVIVAGNMNALTGNVHRSGRTALEYTVTGNGNSITGNILYFSGGISIAGNDNNISDNSLYQLACTTAGLSAGTDFWICESGTPTGNKISGNVLTNASGTVTTVGGVKITGTVPSVLGNTFRSFAGTDNGAICIRCETSNANVSGNTEAGCTTFMSTTSYDILFTGNMQASSTDKFLWNEAVYNPPDLANGSDTGFQGITVTGAALGDFVQVSFTQPLQEAELEAYVSAADGVHFIFRNNTGGNLNLDSGTVKVQVSKR
jgi:hypothetical protein